MKKTAIWFYLLENRHSLLQKAVILYQNFSFKYQYVSFIPRFILRTRSVRITIVKFSRRVDTGDEYDKVINVDEGNKIIWSYGSSDDFSEYHKKSGYGWLGAGEGPGGKKGSGLLPLLPSFVHR